MREPKSLLLAMLCLCLVATWVYHLYDKTRYSARLIEKVPIRDSAAIASAIRDSLHQIYAASLVELDSTRLTVDSINNKLSSRIYELNRLKTEVRGILKNRHATQNDLKRARSRITEIKLLLAEMQGENIELESEKARLQSTLDQLSGEVVSLQTSIENLGKENKELSSMVNLASTFVLSDLHFDVVDTRKNKKEITTTHASRADKIVIAFQVKNNILHLPSTDVYIVVTDPIGQVIQNAVWNSGNFITPKEGTIAFTIRERFNYEKSSVKKIIYTLSPGKFTTGNYTLQVYHNGVEIGRAIQKME